MTVKFYIGCDLLGHPREFKYSHEETGVRQICQHIWDRLHQQDHLYVVVANPGYIGAQNLELDPDLAVLSELGLGIVELKDWSGFIDCNEWLSDSGAQSPGMEKETPHQQVRRYAEAVRRELANALPEAQEWLHENPPDDQVLKIHTAVCFTYPYVSLQSCRQVVALRSRRRDALKPWERFKVLTPVEMPEWALDLRFEIDLGEANWRHNYELHPEEVSNLAKSFFHASPWTEMENYVRRGREPVGYLRILGTNSLQRIEDTETLLGRQPDICQVVIPSTCERVSRKHARLVYDQAKFYLEDLDSSRGTYLIDGRPVKGLVEIRPGQRFILGGASASEKNCQLELLAVSAVSQPGPTQTHTDAGG